jgi:hypothetical protein
MDASGSEQGRPLGVATQFPRVALNPRLTADEFPAVNERVARLLLRNQMEALRPLICMNAL